MKNNIRYLILGLIICIFIFFVIIFKNKLDSVNTTKLSTEKIGWGMIRGKNHEQPYFDSNNKKLIDDNDAIAIGNNEYKYVYLTFDNGYEAGYTNQILDTLKQNDVKATFFITGYYFVSQPELVERMIKEGHIVGNHTFNHYSLPDLSEEEVKNEIQTLTTAVFEKFGYKMKYTRPPMGEFSQRTLEITKKLGYTTVMWSFAYDDWDENNQGREEYAKEKIISNMHNGCVILLHANSKDNCNILNYVINQIKDMGYEFKTLDEFEK